jgi:putative phage-type endonuclease
MDQQRTQVWFEKRKGRVTGSNVGAILGLSPFRTADDVLRAMVRDYHGTESEFTGNPATQWGQAMEAGAIAQFQMEHDLTVVPCGFFPHGDWLGASPDGLINADALIEVKCPFSLRNAEKPVSFKSITKQPHYYAQIQVELYCTNREICFFYQWAPNGTQWETVAINREWLNENLPTLRFFHHRFLQEIDNPAHLEPLKNRGVIDTKAAAELLEDYDNLTAQIAAMEKMKAETLADLVELAGGEDAEIHGRKLTLVKKAGAVSYSKAIKELLPDADLEPYRGKPSEYWRLC